MATSSANWSTEQTGYNSTIAASSNGDTNINLDGNGWLLVHGVIDVTLGSASGVTVYIYPSTDGGTSFATAQTLPGSFSITADGVYSLPVLTSISYAKVRVTNDDGANATGTVTVNYKGLEIDTV